MVVDIAISASLGLMVVILASILGAIDRPERFWFVAGLAVFIAAHALVTSPASLGLALAVVGIIMAVVSTVPMLRQTV